MRFHLPSGAWVELGAGSPIELPGLLGDELRGLRVRTSVPLLELPLSDLHVIRALAMRLELVDEPEATIRCSNCQRELSVQACSTLELGPFSDGELDDEELDAPFDHLRAYAVPPLGDGEESTLRLAARTVGEALPLWAAVSASRPLRITSKVVRGMGVVELDGETNPKRIARALARCSDQAFDAIATLFEDAHYPPRLDVPHVCPSCGVTEWVPAPLSRELRGEHLHLPPAPDDTGFISVDEFEAVVRKEAQRAYTELGVRAIDLAVIEGPAEVDDAGEPLLGCYRPPDPEGLVPRPAEIRIFYRTFANIARDEGPYDVEAEVRETLRHEIEHHLGFLSGDDPLDEQEHAEIQREAARRVGKHEIQRRAVRGVAAEVRGFFARTWLVWVIVALATLLAALAESR